MYRQSSFRDVWMANPRDVVTIWTPVNSESEKE
jgi:hypothetical protein